MMLSWHSGVADVVQVTWRRLVLLYQLPGGDTASSAGLQRAKALEDTLRRLPLWQRLCGEMPLSRSDAAKRSAARWCMWRAWAQGMAKSLELALKRVLETVKEYGRLKDFYGRGGPEEDMKALVKRLQRERQELVWMSEKASGAMVAKMMAAKRQIEELMDDFKVFEKGAKSRKKGDVEDLRLREVEDWVREMLGRMDRELQELTEGKKKGKVKHVVEAHQMHMKNLERLVRKMRKEELDVAALETLRESIECYMDEGQNPRMPQLFQRFEEVYGGFGLEDPRDDPSQDTSEHVVAGKVDGKPVAMAKAPISKGPVILGRDAPMRQMKGSELQAPFVAAPVARRPPPPPYPPPPCPPRRQPTQLEVLWGFVPPPSVGPLPAASPWLDFEGLSRSQEEDLKLLAAQMPVHQDRCRHKRTPPAIGHVHRDREGVPVYPTECQTWRTYTLETLFFIFYFQQGTYEQYLAARALSSHRWRYHTKYLTWFLRAQEPFLQSEDFERGNYYFYDFKYTMSIRLNLNFTFEYHWLESQLEVMNRRN